MALFAVYAAGILGVLYYTLVFLPYPELTHHFGFAFNITMLGLLSLLSFLAFRQERHFRSVFFQFWILFAALALSTPIVYHCLYWYGSMGAFIAYTEVMVVGHLLFMWIAAKIFFHYVFHDEKRWAINILSSLVVFPLCVWVFWPFFWNPATLLELPTAASADTIYHPVLHAAFISNLISLGIMVAFFLHKLRTDKPVGVFADTLLFLLGLYFLVDAIELGAQVTSMTLMNMSQWANGLLTVGMTVTLILRLKYKSQTIAHYYESHCLSLDPRIGRRIGLFDRLMLRTFFDPEKVGERIFLGAGRQAMKVKRTSPRITRPASRV